MNARPVAVVVTRLQAGAGGVALRGALALDPARFRATIIAGSSGETTDSDGSGDSLLRRARRAGLDVIEVPELVPQLAPGTDRRCLRALTGVLAAGRFDVAHTHSAKAGALGRLAAVRAGIPRVVHTFHGFPFHEFQSTPRRAAYVRIERYLSRYTDMFLAVGGAVAAEAVRRGIAAPGQVRVIDPVIESAVPPPGPAVRDFARRRLGVPVGCKVVGTVGRIDYQKAPECFIDAIAWLGRPDVYAVWVGDGPLRREAEQRARRRGLDGRFRCLGHRDDVAALLPGFDVFALASRYEGLPCAVAEAMTAGVPVVATAVNAVPDLVIAGQTGVLVAPGRHREFAAAISHLLDRPEEAARMAAAARGLTAGRFSPETLAQVLGAVYSDGGPRAGRPGRPLTVTRPA
jgi:glycosyltransferase involved in cell wall biosynthesis